MRHRSRLLSEQKAQSIFLLLKLLFDLRDLCGRGVLELFRFSQV